MKAFIIDEINNQIIKNYWYFLFFSKILIIRTAVDIF